MTNPGISSSPAARWLDEFAMVASLLNRRYQEELNDQLDRARRLLAARAPNDSGRLLILAAARQTITQIDRRVLSWIPEASDDRPALVHAHTVCGRLLSSLPERNSLH